MTREEQLAFCKKCTKKAFNTKIGIICSLTDQRADFESSCEHFDGDITDAQRELDEIHSKQKKETKRVRRKLPTKISIPYPSVILLTAISIFAYVLMVVRGVHPILPLTDDLINWGANYSLLTKEGEIWRLLTACFLHNGIIHLAFNMYALIYIGRLLEPVIGKNRFMSAYVLTGIAGSLVSIWFHDIVIGVGASGAIFGLYGVYISLLLTNTLPKNIKNTMLSSILVFVGYNLVFGLKSGIDNAAHFGGLILGLGYGYAIHFDLKKQNKSQYLLASLACVVIIAISSFTVLKSGTSDVEKYQALMQKFAEYEQNALVIYKYNSGEIEKKVQKGIVKQGIPNWKKCQEIVDSMKALQDIPEDFVDRAYLLEDYCKYRIKSYRLIADVLKNKTTENEYELAQSIKRIEKLLKDLNPGLSSEIENVKQNNRTKNDATLESYPENALYVLNGVPTKKKPNIKPEEIKHIYYLDEEGATNLYGKRGENGAVVIQTKH